MLVKLYEMGEVFFHLTKTNVFVFVFFLSRQKMVDFLLRACVVAKTLNLTFEKTHVVVWQTMFVYVELFFLIQQIISFICGIVVAVAVVVSLNSMKYLLITETKLTSDKENSTISQVKNFITYQLF